MKINTYANLEQAIFKLQQRGFTIVFQLANKHLYALQEKKSYSPEELSIVEYHRFRSTSNASNPEIIFAILCHDGTKGYIVSEEETSAYLRLLTTMDKVKVISKRHKLID